MTPQPHSLAGRLRFDNITVAVGDLPAMIAWYETALGFVLGERGEFEAVGAKYAMMDGAGVRIELISRAEPRAPVDRTPPPHHLDMLGLKALVLQADDLKTFTKELSARDVEIVWADTQLSADRRSTLIRDPEGNLINIFGPRFEPEEDIRDL